MDMLKWRLAQWFELRWWKRYLKAKDKQSYLNWKRDYWKNLWSKIASEIPLRNTSTIADMGCGPAGIFIAFPEHSITAVDPLLQQYETCLPLFERSDYPNCRFVTSGIEDVEIESPFDVVFCMNAINHVKDIERAFDVVVKATKRDGHLVISIDAHNYSCFKLLFRLMPGDVLHPHQFSLKEYQSFLENRGMKIKKTELLKQEFFFNHFVLVASL